MGDRDDAFVGERPTLSELYPVQTLRMKAPHLGHMKHLCNMADRGEDLATVKALVKNPKFICRKCGRAAAKEENLCEPVPL